jgi:2-polyprenyl-6-methoxyphenol hydroxylase-like FAD-dependent oxidoreductase
MNDTRTALVVGGGIAGPVAAMALAKAGIESTVYEAYDSTADGVGAGLGLAPNGLAALDILGAGDAVREIGEPVQSMVMQSWTGKRLAELGDRTGPPFLYAMGRSDLYRALYDTARRQGIAVEHGKRLVDLTDTGEAVTARFADGTTATADILVGADGVRSTVRSLIDPAAPQPRHDGLLGFGGWSSAKIPDAVPDTMYMTFGKRAFFSHTVLGDGRVGWFVNLPAAEPMSMADAQAIGAREWLSRLREVFVDDRVPAVAVLDAADPVGMMIVGSLEIMSPAPRWYRGRAVLIGDAAHAPSHSSGQGASQAIEGAVHLARCLRDLPHAAAFPAYEELRRDRIERITAAAERTNSNKAAGPVARVLRDLIMPVAMKKLAKPEKMAWQYGYRIDWDAPVGAAPSPVAV